MKKVLLLLADGFETFEASVSIVGKAYFKD
jgi:hypothetical protein